MPNQTKSPGQRAYEKYAEYQLHIPRMEIRPLTWEELGNTFGNAQEQWEEIAKAAWPFSLTSSVEDHQAGPLGEVEKWKHQAEVYRLETHRWAEAFRLLSQSVREKDAEIVKLTCALRGEEPPEGMIFNEPSPTSY